jgi:hypothetical protein
MKFCRHCDGEIKRLSPAIKVPRGPAVMWVHVEQHPREPHPGIPWIHRPEPGGAPNRSDPEKLEEWLNS